MFCCLAAVSAFTVSFSFDVMWYHQDSIKNNSSQPYCIILSVMLAPALLLYYPYAVLIEKWTILLLQIWYISDPLPSISIATAQLHSTIHAFSFLTIMLLSFVHSPTFYLLESYSYYANMAWSLAATTKVLMWSPLACTFYSLPCVWESTMVTASLE